MEFWAFEQDEIWDAPESKIHELAEKELRYTKLIKPDTPILNFKVIKVPRCYPVYETGYQKHLKTVEQFLDGIQGLIPIGRYGAFKYNNQDHSILMGLLSAQKIADGKEVNLWEINTDIEYQEEGKIKDVLIQ